MVKGVQIPTYHITPEEIYPSIRQYHSELYLSEIYRLAGVRLVASSKSVQSKPSKYSAYLVRCSSIFGSLTRKYTNCTVIDEDLAAMGDSGIYLDATN